VIGTVTAFDGHAGLGVVTAVDGTPYPFHCVELADGTRMIDVGADVEFRPLPKLGRIEAADVRRRR
jgi:CspA family cold shock protein